MLPTNHSTKAIELVGRSGRKSGGKTSKNQKHSSQGCSKDDQLASSRAVLAKLGPHHTSLAEVLPQLVSTEFVVNQASEGNSVAESLEKGDGIAEEEHGRKDQ